MTEKKKQQQPHPHPKKNLPIRYDMLATKYNLWSVFHWDQAIFPDIINLHTSIFQTNYTCVYCYHRLYTNVIIHNHYYPFFVVAHVGWLPYLWMNWWATKYISITELNHNNKIWLWPTFFRNNQSFYGKYITSLSFTNNRKIPQILKCF